MKRPIFFNIPQGMSKEEALPSEVLQLLEERFHSIIVRRVNHDAFLYKIDVGRFRESIQNHEVLIAGQYVFKSDGEIYDFEINDASRSYRFNTTDKFLEKEELDAFLSEMSDDSEEENGGVPDSPLCDLLLQAINEEDSEPYQSPFASDLRKDLNYLGVLLALMAHAGATIEAQPLYAGLYLYLVKFVLSGLKLFSSIIEANEGEDAGEAADAWVDEHGLDFATAVIKEYSSMKCDEAMEIMRSNNQRESRNLKNTIEEALNMAMACTLSWIKEIVEAEDYEAGEVRLTLATAIEEYCPIDNTNGYNAAANAKQLSAQWQEVVNQSGCTEDLGMQALGLPSAVILPPE